MKSTPIYLPPFKQVLDRREFLQAGAQLGIALAACAIPGMALGAASRLRGLPDNPFTLGIASGDPTPDSVVLWTRLDTGVLERASANEMAIEVDFEIADSANFANIKRTGTVVALPEMGHSVHAEVRGLEPGREYFYRWMVASEISGTGRTKTAPAANADVDAFRFAIASCQQYEHGFFTAYQHMAEEDLDLIVHLGDYIYESSWGQNLVRAHEGPEIRTLSDYRRRYETYKSDPQLQLAHAAAPWVVTWDDHEVDNNYAGMVPEDDQTPTQLLRRRSAAYQAYYEFMPIRLPVGRAGPDMPIHRRLRFGNLMEMNVLDTRQYRSDQSCGDGRKASCYEHQDPSRTLLGEAQKNWLFESLATADAHWNVIAQQIMMAGLRSVSDTGEDLLPMDIWDGYPFERQELLQHMLDVKTPNPVVLTGDIHSNWVADLKADFDDPRSPIIGTEFVGTSITSGGDGTDTNARGTSLLANNPHVKFHNAQRGYIKATLDSDLWQSEFKVLPYITRPDAEISTRARYVVEVGQPGAQLG